MKWTRRHGIRIRGLWAPDMLLAAALVAAVRVNEVKGSIMILATCALEEVVQRQSEKRRQMEYGWGKGAKNDDVCTALQPPSLSLSLSLSLRMNAVA